jgi:hypothetical protein
MSNYALALLVGSALMAATVGACSAQQPAPATGSPVPASYFMGKYRGEVVKRLGEPTEAIPLIETGGELLIYAHPGQTHYVFETAPGGIIDKAVVVK